MCQVVISCSLQQGSLSPLRSEKLSNLGAGVRKAQPPEANGVNDVALCELEVVDCAGCSCEK